MHFPFFKKKNVLLLNEEADVPELKLSSYGVTYKNKVIGSFLKYVECVELTDITDISNMRKLISLVKRAKVTKKRGYQGLDNYRKVKYDFLHKMLDKEGFVNGDATKNTFEKNPKADFWYRVFGLADKAINHPDLNDDHHASTARRQIIDVHNFGNVLSALIDGYREKLPSLLKAIIDKTGGGSYAAGSLCVGPFIVNISDKTFFSYSEEGLKGKLTDKEMLLSCFIYVQNKIPNSSYYSLAKDYIRDSLNSTEVNSGE